MDGTPVHCRADTILHIRPPIGQLTCFFFFFCQDIVSLIHTSHTQIIMEHFFIIFKTETSALLNMSPKVFFIIIKPSNIEMCFCTQCRESFQSIQEFGECRHAASRHVGAADTICEADLLPWLTFIPFSWNISANTMTVRAWSWGKIVSAQTGFSQWGPLIFYHPRQSTGLWDEVHTCIHLCIQ